MTKIYHINIITKEVTEVFDYMEYLNTHHTEIELDKVSHCGIILSRGKDTITVLLPEW